MIKYLYKFLVWIYSIPRGTLVQVNNSRFHGIGIVATPFIWHDNNICVGVTLENGNEWYYSRNTVKKHKGPMPLWVQKNHYNKNGKLKVGKL